MSNHFNRVITVNHDRSVFNLSKNRKTTFNSGDLVPFYLEHVLPGDTFHIQPTLFARLSTMIVPVMDDLIMDVFFFYVPHSMVYAGWDNFITGSVAGSPVALGNGPASAPDADFFSYNSVRGLPFLPAGAKFEPGSLGDYLGFPPGYTAPAYPTGGVVPPGFAIPHTLAFRSYFKICSSWFRDPNYQLDTLDNDFPHGPDDKVRWPYNFWSTTDTLGVLGGPENFWDFDSKKPYLSVSSLHKRFKIRDYFTSCLPWPQKGPQVDLPLAGFARVISSAEVDNAPDGSGRFAMAAAQDATFVPGMAGVFARAGTSGSDPYLLTISSAPVSSSSAYWPKSVDATGKVVDSTGLVTDMSSVSSISVNDLRDMITLQHAFELDARAGTRLPDVLLAHFGVSSLDLRLCRPQFLYSYSTPIIVNPVVQTSSTDSKTPQGNLAGYGISVLHGDSFTNTFVDFGYIIGIVNVRAHITYQQGIPRHMFYTHRFDFPFPVFAHLGEQPVYNREIYATGGADDYKVFGYQERFAECRVGMNSITGLFRSGVTGSLDIWHFSDHFASLPVLSTDFLLSNPPVSRVQAVTTEPQFFFDSHMKVKVVRCLPSYGTPGVKRL